MSSAASQMTSFTYVVLPGVQEFFVDQVGELKFQKPGILRIPLLVSPISSASAGPANPQPVATIALTNEAMLQLWDQLRGLVKELEDSGYIKRAHAHSSMKQ